MADFTSASMQGANLSLAGLEGAVLRDAELEGASLRMATLHGADMTGAKLQGSDLARRPRVAHDSRPAARLAPFADMAQIALRPRERGGAGRAVGASLAHVEDGPLKARLADTLLALADAGQNASWATSPDQQLWQGLARSSGDAAIAEGYKTRLTDYPRRG